MNRRRRLLSKSTHEPLEFNEHMSLSFARPVRLPVNAMTVARKRRRMEEPLVSPTTSEASSIGEAPSMISDRSSRMSASPRVIKSARTDPLHPRTPPLHRHLSLPSPSLDNTSALLREAEQHKVILGTQSYQRLHQFAEVATREPPLQCRSESAPEVRSQKLQHLPPCSTLKESAAHLPPPSSTNSIMKLNSIMD